jgi:hypothetical protein
MKEGNEMKVTKATERTMETCYTLYIENEGKEYVVNMYSSDKNSYTDWLENHHLIEQPDWADDLDLWELWDIKQAEKVEANA